MSIKETLLDIRNINLNLVCSFTDILSQGGAHYYTQNQNHSRKEKEGTTDMRGIFLSMEMEWRNQVEMRMDIYTYIHIHKHHQNVK